MRHSTRADGGHFPESNCSLSEEGKQLALQRGAVLASKMSGLDCIYVSPFERTLETAQIVHSHFKSCKLKVTYDLAETLTVGHNNYQNITLSDQFREELKSKGGIALPESDSHIKERCLHLIAQLNATPFENVLLISHAGLVQVFASLLSPGAACNLGYCDVACFEQQQEKWTPVCI